MKTTVIFSLAIVSITQLASAAECGNKWMGVPDSTTLQRFWNARSATCNCIATQPGNYCGNLNNQFLAFAIWGTRPTTQICWDGFENIINQCIKQGWNSGLYQYSGSNLQITRWK
ncbi:hypothetical protein LMH87_009530 [Akanthomyces muscarius]|uniref:Uncharacterized protein n=1 Tax=Akanthomyces muscarius TaxID=2231603 RepID=A0A9W8QBJ2_AKAMU|nr:hypothetical protein LMH87_009530 [Akanthomyces muscarius]KAJ4153018.1 hypothetical protein LMH87_009530 [Akanthomyces muscarius]